MLALVIGLLASPWVGAGFLVASLLLVHVFHLAQLSRLLRWLTLTDPKHLAEVLESTGAWGDVLAALYRLRRDEAAAQHRLSISLDQFRQAAEVVPDGIIMLDRYLRIDWSNPAATRYLGIVSARDKGLSIMDLVRDPVFAEYAESPSDGPAVVIRTSMAPVYSLSLLLRSFGHHRYLLICQDITAIERVDTMRRDFVANVSHELKTPLTVIIGFLEGLIDCGADVNGNCVSMARQYALMQDQALRMDRLVSDLLTLSNLEESAVPRKQEQVDVPTLIGTLIEEARALSGGRHMLTAEMSWAIMLHGNHDELHSAFSNLISNAVRYTPDQGQITVRWYLRDKQPVFEVADSGIGIALEHVSRLTERFYRADKSRSSATGGTGLGLAIVKHVLLRHQAKLEIESRPGEGSTFRAVFGIERAV